MPDAYEGLAAAVEADASETYVAEVLRSRKTACLVFVRLSVVLTTPIAGSRMVTAGLTGWAASQTTGACHGLGHLNLEGTYCYSVFVTMNRKLEDRIDDL